MLWIYTRVALGNMGIESTGREVTSESHWNYLENGDRLSLVYPVLKICDNFLCCFRSFLFMCPGIAQYWPLLLQCDTGGSVCIHHQVKYLMCLGTSLIFSS